MGCGDDSFVKGGMRQLNSACDIPARINIYACGDITGGVQLAHAAFHEGIVAASHASGKDMKVNSEIIPRCIYTSPEIASVGLNEKKARERYGDVRMLSVHHHGCLADQFGCSRTHDRNPDNFLILRLCDDFDLSGSLI